MTWEAVIGLEVHAQLSTASKLFCGCATSFGATPNANTCEVCLGMPGVLPVLNRRAVELAVRAATALGCEVHPRSQWSRKNYFYPDLPKGYQISQYDQPYATGGGLTIEVGGATRRIALTRIHMEEDAGKSVHDDPTAGGRSYVDFNRGGTPLIEIVSEPEIRSPEEAAAYVRTLRQLLRYIDVCDGNMERGNLRCDANVSVRPGPSAPLGTRTELKNLNSFRFLQAAVEHEITRQIDLIESGGAVVQETRLWDTAAKVTRSMRSKEEAHDYRYFPEPDLPDLVLADDWLAAQRDAMPELPAAAAARFSALGLADDDARLLTEDPQAAAFFDAAVAVHQNPKGIANWVINELFAAVKTEEGTDLAALPFGPAEVAELIRLIDDGTISGKIAKDVFAVMLKDGGAPAAIVEAQGLRQVTDAGSLEPIIDEIIAQNPDSVAQFKAGKTKVIGFFVGQVMKATRGKANPGLVNELLKKKLGG